MLDNLLNRDTRTDGARYVAPEVSYLLDTMVNVVFVGAPKAGDRVAVPTAATTEIRHIKRRRAERTAHALHLTP